MAPNRDNPDCANCMVHSGYEASAVLDTFGSFRGLWATIRATFLSGGYRTRDAAESLEAAARARAEPPSA